MFYVQNIEKKNNDKHKQTTTTELQAHDLVQALHTELGGV